MGIFAIADLHLSLGRPKEMDVFGEHWKGHWEKISQDWRDKVGDDDVVLIPGDISWAMKLSDAVCDLDAICALPGKKIFLKGNHDYWWNSASQVKAVIGESADIIQNNHIVVGEWVVCGTRGWVFPTDTALEAHDEKIFAREQARLRLSLESAKRQARGNIIVMMHYPPIFDGFTDTAFAGIIAEYGVKEAVFGHLHGAVLERVNLRDYLLDGVRYNLVSADYLDFKLKRIV